MRPNIRTCAFDGRPVSRNPDTGFTLIELLIVISVLPVVVGAISIALIAVISQQTTVSNKISDVRVYSC